MPIVFNSKLDSTVANATWLDKTQDDSTVGVLELANPGTGTTVANAQLEILKSQKLVFAEVAKSGGGTIVPNDTSMYQEFRLVGSGGAITMAALPFSSQPSDGAELILVGHDDTNTVTFTDNRLTQYGLKINGDATLGEGDILTLVYNDEKERYFEKSRNF